MIHSYPRIGVGVLIMQENNVLLSQRKNSLGAESWAFPGGHLEFGETIEECAIRESYEEAGIVVNKIKQLCCINCFFKEDNKHYVTLFVQAHYKSGTPRQCEPKKTSAWKWFDSSNLPAPLFLPIQLLIEEYPEIFLQPKRERTISWI